MSIIPLIKYDALNIHSVDLSNMDGSDKVPVLISLEAAVISKLRRMYPGENLDEEINLILDQKTFESILTLKYKGKTKIRSDVLEKLKKISEFIQAHPLYPNLKLQQIKAIVKDVLGISDPRVFHEFIKTINDCIYSYSGKRLSLYESIDYSCFIRAVNEKLSEKY